MTATLAKMTENIKAALANEIPAPEPLLPRVDLEKLGETCSKAFGERIQPEILEKIVNYCSYVGRRINGRTAGKIEDLVIRYLFRYYACGIEVSDLREVCHIEIGVLFGAGVVYPWGATRLAGKKISIVAIDPFQGFYGASVDPISKLEVTEQRFRDNLALFDISDVEVVRGFSTDPAVYQQCRSRKALSVLIDGDHSYKGVLSDWNNFSGLVVRGGYVLLDDYKSPSWPEIAQCVDAEILPRLGSEWETRLVYGNSLLFQRRAEVISPSQQP